MAAIPAIRAERKRNEGEPEKGARRREQPVLHRFTTADSHRHRGVLLFSSREGEGRASR